MTSEVMILGGYGNFGKRIARGLNQRGVPVIIAGRDMSRAEALCAELPLARPVRADIRDGLEALLRAHKPAVVVHTCGPFQGADYGVARACIKAGVHYLDLSDGREFVTRFKTLDAEARASGIAAITGASTVPGLSSAVIEHFLPRFARLESVDFGISPGQGAERGLATTRGILSYVGRRLKPFAGHPKACGWQDLRSELYPGLGRRWLANCDIPDLDLLPERYGLSRIRFGAGLELFPLHAGLWLAGWAVRLGLPVRLESLAEPLLAIANLFDGLGSRDGGMHMILGGEDHDGRPLTLRWYIIAKEGDGPQIPCVPAILLAQRLWSGEMKTPGAMTAAGLISLEDYVRALSPFAVELFYPPIKSILPSGTPL